MNKLRQSFVIGIIVILSTFSFATQAANLIAFIASDTLDESIGTSVNLDFEHIRTEMKNVANYTGLNLKEILMKDRANTTKTFLQNLKSLRANNDDVIVFYYAGHGYRTYSKGDSPWPNLVFTQEAKHQHKGIEYDYVIHTLMEKQPRLLLTIADVCNSFTSRAPPIVTKKAMATAPNIERIRANYKHLYLDEVGMINVTSAKMGELATGNYEDGGAFTKAFLDSLKNETENASVASWHTILERASAKVTQDSIGWAKEEGITLDEAQKKGDIQHPYFEIITNNSISD